VEALKQGRQNLVTKCRNNLQRRADGYEYEEVKTTEAFVAIPKPVRDMLLEAGIDADRVFNTEIKTVKIETTKKRALEDIAANNALLRVHDPNWHESTEEARKLKREELDIKKQRAEAETW
jgi:hypothetical protein